MSEFEEGLATGLLLGDGGGGTIIQKTFTQNGTYHAIADAVDGYDPVIVDVPIASKNITKNGIYYAVDDDLRGFDPVNVNVPMYWTFQPGETVPPIMDDPDYPKEEEAPEYPGTVPHPTQEDPQRVIKPQFTFEKKTVSEGGQDFIVYGGVLTDTITGEQLEPIYTAHLLNPGEEASVVSWKLENNVLTVGYRYNTFDPGVVYYDYLRLSTDCGGYTASYDSGQNTTTVHGG